MLVQALKNLSPLFLLPPEITGGIALASGKWGINLAAARLNFPDKGLKVQIPVWSNKSLGDKVELLLNNGRVDQHTVTDSVELSERTTLFVPADRLQSGPALLAYRVTRLNQQAEPFTPPLELDVKLEIPAGQDTDPEYGHSGLYMAFDPKEIVQDGVDKDSAKNGVDILIQAKPGSGTDRPYENIAVDDVIPVSWGGQLVLSDPVTQAQIDDPLTNPIKVHIDEATILKAGDSGLEGLAVSFMVRDRVHNQSEDWCKETRIVVDTGNSRLEAPILKQADGDILDLEKLGRDEPLLLQVWAASAEFKKDDVIIMNLTGTTLDGDAIDLKVRQSIDKNPPTLVEVLLSNPGARALAKTQARFSYELERDGEIIQNSKGRFIHFIGELQRLAVPIAEDAQDGALDPDLQSVRIRIPFDPLIQEGMAIELKWFGKRPDGTIYDPFLDWLLPSKEEADDPKGFVITVEGKHLKTLEGGTLELWYNLLWDDDGEIRGRESLHAALLNVGEPRFELVEAIVLGEENGALEPKELPGGVSKITCLHSDANPTKPRDKVFWKLWDADGVLLATDFKELNSVSAGRNVDFPLNAAFVQQYFEANREKTLSVSYEIWRVESNTTSYSNPLVFVIGVAPELKLDPPTLDAPTENPLDALSHPQGVSVRVDFAAAQPGDKAQLVLLNPLPDSPAFSDQALDQAFALFTLDAVFLGMWHGKVPQLRWDLIRGGQVIAQSLPLVLTVNRIADEDPRLPTPVIVDQTGQHLDVNELVAADKVNIGPWALYASGQFIWLRYDGFDSSGAAIHFDDLEGFPHSGTPGVTRPALVDWLKALKDGTTVTITFRVNFGKVDDLGAAVTFPTRTYTVKIIPRDSENFDSTPDRIINKVGESFLTEKLKVTIIELILAIAYIRITAVSQADNPLKGKYLYPFGVRSYSIELIYGTANRITFWLQPFNVIGGGEIRYDFLNGTGAIIGSKTVRVEPSGPPQEVDSGILNGIKSIVVTSKSLSSGAQVRLDEFKFFRT